VDLGVGFGVAFGVASCRGGNLDGVARVDS